MLDLGTLDSFPPLVDQVLICVLLALQKDMFVVLPRDNVQFLLSGHKQIIVGLVLDKLQLPIKLVPIKSFRGFDKADLRTIGTYF
jgi:hypothetical protein